MDFEKNRQLNLPAQTLAGSHLGLASQDSVALAKFEPPKRVVACDGG